MWVLPTTLKIELILTYMTDQREATIFLDNVVFFGVFLCCLGCVGRNFREVKSRGFEHGNRDGGLVRFFRRLFCCASVGDIRGHKRHWMR